MKVLKSLSLFLRLSWPLHVMIEISLDLYCVFYALLFPFYYDDDQLEKQFFTFDCFYYSLNFLLMPFLRFPISKRE